MATPAYITSLKTRRTAICAELAALSSVGAGGKPNTAGGGGAHVDHVGYKDGLYRELEAIDKLIADAGANVQAEDLLANGPWEVIS